MTNSIQLNGATYQITGTNEIEINGSKRTEICGVRPRSKGWAYIVRYANGTYSKPVCIAGAFAKPAWAV